MIIIAATTSLLPLTVEKPTAHGKLLLLRLLQYLLLLVPAINISTITTVATSATA